MSRQASHFSRRRFLTTAIQAGAAIAAPQIVPGLVLGKGGTPPPSEKIVMAGIGIGGRGSGVLGEFLGEADVQCVAVCDARADRRRRTRKWLTPATATRTASSIATSANCWPATTSTPCSSPPAPTTTPCSRCMPPGPARTSTARNPARRPLRKAWPWPRRSAARGGSSRAACSGGTDRTSCWQSRCADRQAR